MPHYHEIHRAAYDALCEQAAGWAPETVQEALAAGRRHNRLMRLPKPDFRFDSSPMGAEARAQAVRDAWARQKGELRYDPEAQA